MSPGGDRAPIHPVLYLFLVWICKLISQSGRGILNRPYPPRRVGSITWRTPCGLFTVMDLEHVSLSPGWGRVELLGIRKGEELDLRF